MNFQQDSIHAYPAGEIGAFTLDAKVANVFADMIARTDSFSYGLGCSLGAAALVMNRQIQAERCRCIALK